MNFKEEFLKELNKRLRENIDIIQSSFEISNIDLIKNKLYNINPIDFHLSILIEDDPYIFLNKLVFAIINKMPIKASCNNIACDLLLELVNMILDEFEVERVDKIGS